MKRQTGFRASTRSFISRHRRVLLAIGGLFLVIYVFVPQLSDLKECLLAVESSDKTLLLLAIIVFCTGFPIIAAKYYLIAQYPLRYWLNLKVQVAGAFVAKLLPMSIGSLTVNTYYLAKESGSAAAAASTMAFNAITGSFAFIILVIAALIANGSNYSSQAPDKNINWLAVLGLIVLVSIVIWALLHLKKIRARVNKMISSLWADLQTYRKYPVKTMWGVVLNAVGSLTGIITLYICAHSVSVPVTLAQAILAYSLGNIVGSLVPTPGGLGAVEAGLYSGLVFFGYDSATSLVTVLLYRLISYWIPIIPGYLVYRNLKKDILAGFKIKNK